VSPESGGRYGLDDNISRNSSASVSPFNKTVEGESMAVMIIRIRTEGMGGGEKGKRQKMAQFFFPCWAFRGCRRGTEDNEWQEGRRV